MNLAKRLHLCDNQALVGTTISGCVPDIIRGDVSVDNIVGFSANTRMMDRAMLSSVCQQYSACHQWSTPPTVQDTELGDPKRWEDVVIELMLRTCFFQYRAHDISALNLQEMFEAHFEQTRGSHYYNAPRWIVVDKWLFHQKIGQGLFSGSASHDLEFKAAGDGQ
jgi:hypothetical protein